MLTTNGYEIPRLKMAHYGAMLLGFGWSDRINQCPQGHVENAAEQHNDHLLVELRVIGPECTGFENPHDD